MFGKQCWLVNPGLKHIISVDRCFVNFVSAKLKYSEMITHAVHTFTEQEILVAPASPPPLYQSFLNDDADLNKFYITGKGIYRRV